jgi:hypothetical protein
MLGEPAEEQGGDRPNRAFVVKRDVGGERLVTHSLPHKLLVTQAMDGGRGGCTMPSIVHRLSSATAVL